MGIYGSMYVFQNWLFANNIGNVIQLTQCTVPQLTFAYLTNSIHTQILPCTILKYTQRAGISDSDVQYNDTKQSV